MKIDAGTCAQLVNAAHQSCVSDQVRAPAPEAQHFDALANAFASLSTAYAWGAILLGLLALLAGIGWAYYVKGIAEREARTEAKECAKVEVEKWLAKEAPQIVRRHVETLIQTSVSGGRDDEAADEIGKEAG